MNMLKIDTTRLNLAILSQQDSQGKTCYHVVFADKHIRFRNFSSVLDFVEMNKDLGYVIEK